MTFGQWIKNHDRPFARHHRFIREMERVAKNDPSSPTVGTNIKHTRELITQANKDKRGK